MRALLIVIALLLLTGWKQVVMTTEMPEAQGQIAWSPSNHAMVNGQYRKLLSDQKRGLLDAGLTPAQIMELARAQTPVPPPHYHAITPDAADATGAVYVGTWDGRAPCVTVLTGSLYERTLAFFGWPMIDCNDYVAPPRAP